MPTLDPSGRAWRHHLRAERSSTNTEPKEVAEYFLSYLTLDDIDEEGKRPNIPFAAFADGNFVDVYWDWNFTFATVEEMAQVTLPDQLVGMEPDEDTEVIGGVWYDGVKINWLPLLAEEEMA